MEEIKKKINKISSNAAELELFGLETGINEPFMPAVEDMAELKRLQEAKYRKLRSELKTYGADENR